MASPVYAAMPTAGSLLAAFTLAASGSIGAFVDATAVFQSDIAYLDKTGGTAAATSGVACSAYYAYAQTTITAALSAAGTSASVTSATGLYVGQKIAIGTELVTISVISGTTITISALQYAHANGTPIYLVTQTADVTAATLGQNLTAANTTYSTELHLQPGAYFVNLVNLDAANSVIVEMTQRSMTGIV